MALSELVLPDDRAELTGRGMWKDETELDVCYLGLEPNPEV